MRAWVAASVCGLAGMTGLAGCSGGAFGPASMGVGEGASSGAGGAKSAGATLTGMVRGGQAPIVGAHVYLLAANTTGYGGNGIVASASNASASLLTGGTVDTSGGATNGDYYVTTDGSGNWTITGDYTCTAGQQVYLYSLGGNPGGSGANAAAGLMAALGACPSGGSFATATPYVVINEVSTVAAAYALAGFATDALHVSSSGTAPAQTGLANAFANVTNVETVSTGLARALTPAGNGAVPQTEINTLADVLAACVNTNGAVTGPANATVCYTLFTSALAGGTSGAQPTDTATAAINIAHNPGTNVSALYGLAGGTPPFAPGLTSVPNDWTVMLYYANVGVPQSLAVDAAGNVWVANGDFPGSVAKLSNTGAFLSGSHGYMGGGIDQAFAIAIDNSGNAWAGSYDGAITEISNSGTFLSGANGYTGGGTSDPTGVTIDGSGNIWVSSYPGSVTELSSSGSILSGSSGFTGGGLAHSSGIAVDVTGDVWIANGGSNSVTKLSNSGSILSGTSGFTGGGISAPSGIALDGSGNAWVSNATGNSVTRLSNSGSILSGTSGFTGGGLNSPNSVAIDGAGNAWIVNKNSISELSNSGSILSGPNGLVGGSPNTSLDFPHGIAIDGSGNLWMGNGYGVSQVIGAAAPVVTPLAAGVKNNLLGARPAIAANRLAYGVSYGTSPLSVASVNTTTGAVSTVYSFPMSFGPIMSGGTYDSNGQRYFQMDGSGNLYVIDVTGVNAAQVLTGLPMIDNLTYSATTGLLYGINDGASPATVVSVNPANGTVTPVYTFGAGLTGGALILSGGALDATGQRYFQLDSSGGLHVIDLTGVNAAQVVSGVSNVSNLTYNSYNGLLYGLGSTGPNSTLVSVDPSSGAMHTVYTFPSSFGSILSGGALDAFGQRYLEIDSSGKMYAISLAWDTAAQSYSSIPDIIDLSY